VLEHAALALANIACKESTKRALVQLDLIAHLSRLRTTTSSQRVRALVVVVVAVVVVAGVAAAAVAAAVRTTTHHHAPPRTTTHHHAPPRTTTHHHAPPRRGRDAASAHLPPLTHLSFLPLFTSTY
jgi:hypothetical protein